MTHTSQLCEAALIAKVREHPHLYDVHHKDYKDSRKCIQTWSQIAKDIGCPGEWKMCKERWRTLRDVYVRNRKSIMVGDAVRKRPKWRFFDQMNFLHSYINHRAPETEVYTILPSHWVGPEDVETVLCEEAAASDSEAHDDNSNSTSFNSEELILTTVDGRPIKEEIVEWMDEELEGSESFVAPDGGETLSSVQSSSTPIVSLSTGQWDSEKIPKKRAKKLNHLSLDSLPIQIKNISGSLGRAKGTGSPRDQIKKDKEQLPTEAVETTYKLRSVPTCHTPDVKPKILSTKTEYIEEEEELFGKYIAAAIKKLTDRSKSLAKMRIQEVLFNLEESDRNSQTEKLKKSKK
ncbi:uncharacterized protein [Procambarus clarkii]|uniref:uncharacterized protein n=1 Tax=Procambarus clarkii TaxID=6728 RepID=UPI0037426607